MGNGAVRGVDELLAAARERIERLEPAVAWAAAGAGEALLVDIRSQDDRRRDGVVPARFTFPRTVLEWRVDPASEWRNPHVGGRERRLVLLCSHGFASSLAAASLVDLGFSARATCVGGFVAWRRDGAPGPHGGRVGRGLTPGWARRTDRVRSAEGGLMADNGKVVVNLCTGLEDPERVMIAFLVGGAALDAGKQVAFFLTKEAVRLALPGFATGEACRGCPPSSVSSSRSRRRAASCSSVRSASTQRASKERSSSPTRA